MKRRRCLGNITRPLSFSTFLFFLLLSFTLCIFILVGYHCQCGSNWYSFDPGGHKWLNIQYIIWLDVVLFLSPVFVDARLSAKGNTVFFYMPYIMLWELFNICTVLIVPNFNQDYIKKGVRKQKHIAQSKYRSFSHCVKNEDDQEQMIT